MLRHEFDLLGSGCVSLGPQLPWHTDFKTRPRMAAAVLARHRVRRARSADRRQGAVGAQPLPALHRARPGVLADRRRALRAGVRRRSQRLDRAESVGLRRQLGVRDGRRAARRQLDLGLLLHGRLGRLRGRRRSAARFSARCTCTASSSRRTSSAPTSTATTTCATASGWSFSARSFGRPRKGRRWLDTGREIVVAEIFNQTSEDGVDFEKSTAYHRLVLEAFLTCGVLLDRHGEPLAADVAVAARADARVRRGVHQARRPRAAHRRRRRRPGAEARAAGASTIIAICCRPAPSLFGRGDFKRAARQFDEESFWLLGPDGAAAFDAHRAAPRAARSRGRFPTAASTCCAPTRAHVFVDCGEVGMHGRGGHGHNDILSFELWLDGMNLVTDCGAYLYTASREWRNRFRSTAFHNVVQVDGEELNRFISSRRPVAASRRCASAGCRVGARRAASTIFAARTPVTCGSTPPVSVTREIALVKDGPDVHRPRRDRRDGDSRAGLALSPRSVGERRDRRRRRAAVRAAGARRGCSVRRRPARIDDDD